MLVELAAKTPPGRAGRPLRLAAEPVLAVYHYLPAARAEFLHRLHRDTEAAAAYHEALHLTDNAVEREFLTTRLAQLQPARPTSTNRPSESCRGPEDDRA